MIRRSPSERYIKYLILHPKKYSDADIREALQFAQLDVIGDWYLRRLRLGINPPRPFYPLDRRHAISQKYLAEQGLTGLFHKDDFVRKAFQIVEWPRVKEYVEAMLMTTAPKHFIAQWVSRNLDFECDREVIQKYAKYFWDLNLLDTSELRALLQMRFESLDKHPDPEIKEQARAFKSVGYRDARRLAADMPFSPISSILVQLRMGILPNHIDVSRILKKTREVTSIKLFEAVTSNNKGDSSKAFDLSVVMEKMNAVLESMGQPAEELKEQLAAIALHTDTSTIPTIHQLSQGQHTVEVAPIGTTDELTDVYQGDEDDSELDDS